jgi:hypothetical protein
MNVTVLFRSVNPSGLGLRSPAQVSVPRNSKSGDLKPWFAEGQSFRKPLQAWCEEVLILFEASPAGSLPEGQWSHCS